MSERASVHEHCAIGGRRAYLFASAIESIGNISNEVMAFVHIRTRICYSSNIKSRTFLWWFQSIKVMPSQSTCQSYTIISVNSAQFCCAMLGTPSIRTTPLDGDRRWHFIYRSFHDYFIMKMCARRYCVYLLARYLCRHFFAPSLYSLPSLSPPAILCLPHQSFRSPLPSHSLSPPIVPKM